MTTIERTGAGFARGQSKQDYATPDILIAAIKRRFVVTEFAYDLAASAYDCKSPMYFNERDDSLAQEWRDLSGDLWLNPPFSSIAPWAAKCARSLISDGVRWPGSRRIFFLIPAAVGSNWWRDHVHEKARVVFLNGRPSFDGKGGFPKDIALCVYGEKPGYEVWSWRDGAP